MIIVDRITNVTVGAAMLLDDMHGSEARDHWDDTPVGAKLQEAHSDVSDEDRRSRYGQSAVTVLITGLTRSGKRTIAQALERRLFDAGRACTVLDGPKMRLGISKDLGFTADDRSENLRRAAEVARILNDAGLIAIASFLAPEDSVREKSREVIGPDRFYEVYLDVPVDVCRQRDTTGMYEMADAGEISNFPGVTAKYDPPPAPDLTLEPHNDSVESCVDAIVALLQQKGVLS